MTKLKEDINFNPKAIKLKAGEGDWYALYQNGRVVYEGNKQQIITKLKSVTTYTDSYIEQLLKDSLTTWMTLDNVNLNKLKQEYLSQMPTIKLKYIVDTILEQNDVTNTALDHKIKNPETGKDIKISSALTYDPNSTVYKLAKNIISKIEQNKDQINQPQTLDDKIINITKKYETDEQDDIGIYLDILKSFQKANNEENKKKAISLFNVKNETELKNIIGDGNIIGMRIKAHSKNSFEFNALTDEGLCDRTINLNDKSVHMNYFRIDPTAPKGTGSKIFTNQLNNFKKIGIEKVYVTAGGNPKDKTMNGYYTWARLGYDFSSNNEKKKFNKLIKSSTDSEINSVNSLHVLMSFEKGRTFWKDYGFGFDGVFDLKDGSTSLLILNKYMEGK